MEGNLDFKQFTGAQWVIVCVMFVAVWIFMEVVSRRKNHGSEMEDDNEEELEPEISEEKWAERFAEADKVVKETIASLPREVRAEAEKVSFLIERWPPEGYDRTTLGLFQGFEQGKVSESRGPISIYVGGHHVMDAEGEAVFAEEVRRTYLHELGHHLGLDEGEMEERGLA